GGVLGCRPSLRPPRYDEVHFEPDQLGRQVGQPVDPTLRISIVDDNILALNPSEFAQPLPERVEQGLPIGRGRQAKKTYPKHLSRLLLCTHTHGARDRTTNKCNELPARHSTPSSTITRPGYQMISHRALGHLLHRDCEFRFGQVRSWHWRAGCVCSTTNSCRMCKLRRFQRKRRVQVGGASVASPTAPRAWTRTPYTPNGCSRW